LLGIRQRGTDMKMLYIASVLLGGILLVPSGAHVLEMSRKLVMDRDTYFATQQIYLGWALFGIPIVVKIALDTWLGIRSRQTYRAAGSAALVSAALIACGLVVFFVSVQPANVATSNWARQVANWEVLRRNWEYGHAAIALLTLLAFGVIGSGATRLCSRE
jgi:hypothetical protein